MFRRLDALARHLRRSQHVRNAQTSAWHACVSTSAPNKFNIACNKAAAWHTTHQRSSWSQQQLWWPAASAVLAAVAVTSPVSHAGNERLEPEALAQLAEELRNGSMADKERAVSMLSSLTLYVDHHDAILAAGVLPSLLVSVKEERLIPQVRAIALDCVAHLMKSAEARREAAGDAALLTILRTALLGEGAWAEGPEEGGTARCYAARFCAELAGDGDMHPALLKSGLADTLADRAATLAKESSERGAIFRSMRAVPGNLGEHAAVEEESALAAALFGLAGSPAGVSVLLKHPDAVAGVVTWSSQSKDPVLSRFGVGSLARLATSGSQGAALVAKSGGLEAFVKSLRDADGQTVCYAARATGHLAAGGGELSNELLRLGGPQELLAALTVSTPAMSDGVRQGMHRCVLRAISTAASSPSFKAAFREAEAPAKIQALLEGNHLHSDELQKLATSAIESINA